MKHSWGRPVPSAADRQAPAARLPNLHRPPIDRLAGVFLDAGDAARGRSPEPSAVLIEGDSYRTGDPDYPGGHLTEGRPGDILPWSIEVEDDLAAIAGVVRTEASARSLEQRLRVDRAAAAVAVHVACQCSAPDPTGTLYDVGQCAGGQRPIPCTRADGDQRLVVEITRLASDDARSWPGRWLVAETEDNRQLLAAFAERVQRALDHADAAGRRSAETIGRKRVNDYVLDHRWSGAETAARESR